MRGKRVPEMVEGEAAGDRFSDALRAIFGVDPERAATIRASVRASDGPVKRARKQRRDPAPSASGTVSAGRSRGESPA